MPDENSTSVVASVCINYILFGNNLFVPRSFVAFRALHIPRSVNVSCPQYAAEGRNISVAACLTFVVTGCLFNF